jgi:surface polysaccharide O-acyltransferase-like enzyme
MLSDSRLFWADFLRVAAIFLVIVIHLAALVVFPWDNAFTFSWWSAHVLNSISMSAVPWLALLSGGLLLSKVESWQLFYRKRALKIVVPWIFWVSVSLLLDALVIKSIQLSSENVLSVSWMYLRTAYWFIPALVQLYMITPLLRNFVKKVSVAQLLSGAFLFQLIISVQHTYCSTTLQCAPWPLPLGVQYLGYFLLGYAFTQLEVSKILSKVLVFCFLIGLAVTIWGTVILSQLQHGFNATLYSFISVPVFLMGISSFLLMIKCCKGQFNIIELPTGIRSWITKVSPFSFSIFFIHGLFLRLLQWSQPGLLENILKTTTPISILVCSALLFMLSYWVVLISKKIPYLRSVV